MATPEIEIQIIADDNTKAAFDKLLQRVKQLEKELNDLNKSAQTNSRAAAAASKVEVENIRQAGKIRSDELRKQTQDQRTLGQVQSARYRKEASEINANARLRNSEIQATGRLELEQEKERNRRAASQRRRDEAADKDRRKREREERVHQQVLRREIERTRQAKIRSAAQQLGRRDFIGLAGAAADAALAVEGVGFAIAAVGASIIRHASDFERLTRGLEAVTGSAAAAQSQLRDIRELAQLPSITFGEASRVSLRLRASGFNQDTTTRLLREFSNAAAKSGAAAEDVSESLRQLTQIRSTGRFTAENLNIILERLPILRQTILQEFGTTVGGDIQKALEAQGITFDGAIQRLVTGLERTSRANADTFANAMSNLQNAIDELQRNLGNKLIPLLTRFVNFLTRIVGFIDSPAGGAITSGIGTALGIYLAGRGFRALGSLRGRAGGLRGPAAGIGGGDVATAGLLLGGGGGSAWSTFRASRAAGQALQQTMDARNYIPPPEVARMRAFANAQTAFYQGSFSGGGHSPFSTLGRINRGRIWLSSLGGRLPGAATGIPLRSWGGALGVGSSIAAAIVAGYNLGIDLQRQEFDRQLAEVEKQGEEAKEVFDKLEIANLRQLRKNFDDLLRQIRSGPTTREVFEPAFSNTPEEQIRFNQSEIDRTLALIEQFGANNAELIATRVRVLDRLRADLSGQAKRIRDNLIEIRRLEDPAAVQARREAIGTAGAGALLTESETGELQAPQRRINELKNQNIELRKQRERTIELIKQNQSLLKTDQERIKASQSIVDNVGMQESILRGINRETTAIYELDKQRFDVGFAQTERVLTHPSSGASYVTREIGPRTLFGVTGRRPPPFANRGVEPRNEFYNAQRTRTYNIRRGDIPPYQVTINVDTGDIGPVRRGGIGRTPGSTFEPVIVDPTTIQNVRPQDIGAVPVPDPNFPSGFNRTVGQIRSSPTARLNFGGTAISRDIAGLTSVLPDTMLGRRPEPTGFLDPDYYGEARRNLESIRNEWDRIRDTVMTVSNIRPFDPLLTEDLPGLRDVQEDLKRVSVNLALFREEFGNAGELQREFGISAEALAALISVVDENLLKINRTLGIYDAAIDRSKRKTKEFGESISGLRTERTFLQGFFNQYAESVRDEVDRRVEQEERRLETLRSQLPSFVAGVGRDFYNQFGADLLLEAIGIGGRNQDRVRDALDDLKAQFQDAQAEIRSDTTLSERGRLDELKSLHEQYVRDRRDIEKRAEDDRARAWRDWTKNVIVDFGRIVYEQLQLNLAIKATNKVLEALNLSSFKTQVPGGRFPAGVDLNQPGIPISAIRSAQLIGGTGATSAGAGVGLGTIASYAAPVVAAATAIYGLIDPIKDLFGAFGFHNAANDQYAFQKAQEAGRKMFGGQTPEQYGRQSTKDFVDNMASGLASSGGSGGGTTIVHNVFQVGTREIQEFFEVGNELNQGNRLVSPGNSSVVRGVETHRLSSIESNVNVVKRDVGSATATATTAKSTADSALTKVNALEKRINDNPLL